MKTVRLKFPKGVLRDPPPAASTCPVSVRIETLGGTCRITTDGGGSSRSGPIWGDVEDFEHVYNQVFKDTQDLGLEIGTVELLRAETLRAQDEYVRGGPSVALLRPFYLA